MVEKMNWLTADGEPVDIINCIRKYVDMGIPIAIGTDSMLKSEKVVFATAIGFHSNEKNVGNYFFSRQKMDRGLFPSLFSRLGKEISLSIEIGKNLNDMFPESKIEIHADISDSPDNDSNCAADYAKAWNGYNEFKLIIKPNAWAASGCADWHTK